MFDKKEYMRKYQKRWRKDNPEKRKESDKQWRRNNPETAKQYYRQHKTEYKERSKKNTLKRNYDLSYEDWLKIWKSQDGKCAICGKCFKPSNACVDHNHKTDEIRGLLCMKCNMGIGYFDDDPKLMIKAINYLLGE